LVVIARGRIVCTADSAEKAVKIADEEEPGAEHGRSGKMRR